MMLRSDQARRSNVAYMLLQFILLEGYLMNNQRNTAKDSLVEGAAKWWMRR